MESAPVRVFFLWHFHQPWYPELDGSPARLPWVRLHALKDYADLPALLAEDPRVPHAANLVPALLDQLELAANGGRDTFLDLAQTPVSSWDSTAVDFALENFFSAHPRTMVPFPRYAELLRRKVQYLPAGPEALRRSFTAEDLRDLVVYFHLAWSGERLSRDPLVLKLKKRGHRFSEEEKDALLARQAAFLGEVLPAWRKAFSSGVVEAATSPYHHPIVPLLLDTASAREAVPNLPLPSLRFRHPEDARAHLSLGLSVFEKHFGFRPAGMWPPEGSLSEETIGLLAQAGVAWTASDEEVLLHSMPMGRFSSEPGDRARAIFRPWRLHDRGPALFFRDRVLSDRIGFSYATWPAADAAADFVARLLSIRAAAPDAELVVPVILDGENAWETYPENGAPFLRALTRALAKEPRVSVTTPSRALAQVPAARLEKLVAGSWVHGTFTTWIGAPAKNRAWEHLARARDAMGEAVGAAAVRSPLDVLGGTVAPAEKARAALMAAEASDWFWWFGDDHTSAHDAVFDALFRSHLETAYRALSLPAPKALDTPVDEHVASAPLLSTAPISPVIDGKRADYFEWLGSGRLSGQPHGGAMNRGAGLLKEVFFGLDPSGKTLFLRLDAVTPPASAALAGRSVRIQVPTEGPDAAAASTWEIALVPGVTGSNGWKAGVDRIVEIAIPAPAVPAGTPLSLRVVLLDEKGHELEALPTEGWIRFRTVTGDWMA